MELARQQGVEVQERTVDLTELYVADEVFISGTSAFVASVSEIDGRELPAEHPVTERLGGLHGEVILEEGNRL